VNPPQALDTDPAPVAELLKKARAAWDRLQHHDAVELVRAAMQAAVASKDHPRSVQLAVWVSEAEAAEEASTLGGVKPT